MISAKNNPKNNYKSPPTPAKRELNINVLTLLKMGRLLSPKCPELQGMSHTYEYFWPHSLAVQMPTPSK